MIDNFQEIKVEGSSDKIIRQIKNLITSGSLKPGDKLPPERQLAQKLKVGRSVVRDAIRKLEFYGIVKTQPQSGTYIAGIGIVAIEGLISDVLNIEQHDYKSLIETRILLELNAACMAAKRRTDKDIEALQKAIGAFEDKIERGLQAIDEDLLFHLKIAEASKNRVLKSLMLVITPDIVKTHNRLDLSDTNKVNEVISEHRSILEHIINKDSTAAEMSMQKHLSSLQEFSNQEIKIL